MAAAETARLIASLELQDKFSPGVAKAEASMAGLERRSSSAFSKIGSGFATVGKLALVGAGGLIAGLSVALKSGIDSLNELQAVEAQTAAVIKSTGAAAGVTADQIRQQASALEDLTTIDDKTIQRSQNLLLTFTNIKNAAGANNDIFNQATKAVLDLSTAMGSDVKGSAIQLGKALNDPVKGITALTRVGVTFTKQQKEQIKDLVKHNDLLGAQKVILGEVNKEFGGSAAAQANTFAGQQRRLADAFEDLKVALAQGALPGLTAFTKALASLLKQPQAITFAKNLGESLSNLLSPKNLQSAIDFGKSVLPAIADGLRLAGESAKFLFNIWKGLPKELQGLAVAAVVGNKLTGGLLTSGLGDILKGGLKGLGGIFNRGTSAANALWVQQAGLGGGTGPVGGKVGIGSKILGAVTILGTVAIAAESIQLLAQAFGDFQNTVKTSQDNLAKQVADTAKQNRDETLKNLQDTTKNILSSNIFDNVIQSVFGGAQITQDLVSAAQRLEKQTGETQGQLQQDRQAVLDAIGTATRLHLDAAQGPLAEVLAHINAKIDGTSTDIVDAIKTKLPDVAKSPFGPNTTPEVLRELIRWLKITAPKGTLSAGSANTITEQLLKRSLGGSVQTLTGAINSLKVAQVKAVERGDTKTAAAIGRDIDLLTQRLQRVEASRAALLQRAADAVRNTLIVGFGQVVFAVQNIKLPSFLPEGPTPRRNQNAPDRTPAADPNDNQNRGGGRRNIALAVTVHPSATDTFHAGDRKKRISPIRPQ